MKKQQTWLHVKPHRNEQLILNFSNKINWSAVLTNLGETKREKKKAICFSLLDIFRQIAVYLAPQAPISIKEYNTHLMTLVE